MIVWIAWTVVLTVALLAFVGIAAPRTPRERYDADNEQMQALQEQQEE